MTFNFKRIPTWTDDQLLVVYKAVAEEVRRRQQQRKAPKPGAFSMPEKRLIGENDGLLKPR